jgi:hypothetical protein
VLTCFTVKGLPPQLDSTSIVSRLSDCHSSETFKPLSFSPSFFQSHQQASSGPAPAGNAPPFPQVPQTVQGFANMAANLFTPLASMASRATGSAGQAHASGGFPSFGAAQNQPSVPGGHVPQGGGNAQQPSTSFPNYGGQSQQGPGPAGFSFPGVQQQANGAGVQPTFTVNGGGLQGPEQVQNLLFQMFQAFGAANGRQGGATASQGFQRRPS